MKVQSSALFTKRWLLILFLVLSFIAAGAIRLYDLSDLPLDFHPARQLQSMIKARGMYAAVSDYFTPAQTQIAIGQWHTEPTEEPEVVEHLALWTYQLIGREDLWFPRFYSVLFWLTGGVGLYLLLKRMTGTEGALVGTLFYLFLPYGISASRTFMPDPLMIALLIWSLWALLRWGQKPSWGMALVAGLLSGFTIYIKLTSVFFIAAVFFCLMFATFGFKAVWRKAHFWLIGVLAVLPALLYNGLGIYVFHFIGSNAVENRLIPSMLLDPLAYVHWNSMIGTVTGYAAFLLALLGFFLISGKSNRALVLGLAIGYVLFGLVFVYYFTTHDYYHLPLIILASIGLAGLAQTLLPKLIENFQPGWLARTLLLVVLLAGMGEVIWQVRSDFKKVDYRPQAQFWQILGEKLQGTTSLALTEDYNGRLSYWGWYNADYLPAFNELIHRDLAGHESGVADTFAAVAKGKEFLLVTMMDDPTMTGGLMDYMKQTYPVFDQGSGYIIFDLRDLKQ